MTQKLEHLEKLSLSLMEKLEGERTTQEKIADWLTNHIGTVGFLGLNIFFFTFWICWNTGFIPGLKPFDTFPFGFLTMIVSLEAIVLATIVLISQNREARLAKLRTELDLIVGIHSEEEITRVLKMLDEVHDHLHLNPKDDKELREMKGKMNLDHLRELLSRQQ